MEKVEGEGSRLHLRCGEQDAKILTEKLIIATGLNSEPFMPVFKGVDAFGAPLFHVRDFCKNQALIKTTERLVVLGGTKSTSDCAYDFADQGVRVHIVIRESGHGPPWMTPPYVTPLKQRLEFFVMRRACTWMTPFIHGAAAGYAGICNLLHGTTIGRWLVDKFWGILMKTFLPSTDMTSTLRRKGSNRGPTYSS